MPKVMLIEDDATMLSLLQTLLELEGFQVVKAENKGSLDDLLYALRQERPQLVLMDVHLRSFNGFDLLRRIRQDDELKSTPVLMSSGMELAMECQRAGADGFIMKPYMPEELVGKIRKTLEEQDPISQAGEI